MKVYVTATLANYDYCTMWNLVTNFFYSSKFRYGFEMCWIIWTFRKKYPNITIKPYQQLEQFYILCFMKIYIRVYEILTHNMKILHFLFVNPAVILYYYFMLICRKLYLLFLIFHERWNWVTNIQGVNDKFSQSLMAYSFYRWK